MTKIEEIYIANWKKKWNFSYIATPDQTEHIFNAMKEYAEYYAKKCLEIAALNVDCGNIEDCQYDIAKESIKNIKLPEHE